MRLLISVLRRRCRRPPPPPPPPCLRTSFNFFHRSSSHSLFSVSIHRDHNRQSNCGARCSSEVRSISAQNHLQLHRGFSTGASMPEYDEFILPIRTVISLLDSYHDVSGFPWWIIISTSTLAMRLALFPMNVLQLKKLRRIGEILPKLPPPFPPPLSGRSYKEQITLFLKEKKAAGCPSAFWFISSYVIQVPCFVLWLMSIRQMSLLNHPGFDTGGTLWFQNLTELPHGVLGPIIPFIIAGLHVVIVEVSFKKSSLKDLPGTLGLLAKMYRAYLRVLTLPILFAAFNVPQGSLVYWLTNSSLSLIQLICLRNPIVLEFLGMPKMDDAVLVSTKKEGESASVADIFIRTKQGMVSAQTLSPAELVPYSIKLLSEGKKDGAIRILRLALEKDPENVRAMLIMGQTLLQQKQLAGAVECLERAISKLLETGYPTEVEQVDLLILSSIWAGIANIHQGKMQEGLQHLERIAQLEEPEDPRSKAHYYDGILALSSALHHVDRKDEALKYLQKAAAYDPSYNVFFENFETDPKDITSNLANSRREL